MNLGNAIKNIRKQKGVKQTELVEWTGLSQTYLSQIENNVKEPNISTLKLIADKLGVPLPVLFFLAIDNEDVLPEKRIMYDRLMPSIRNIITDFFIN